MKNYPLKTFICNDEVFDYAHPEVFTSSILLWSRQIEVLSIEIRKKKEFRYIGTLFLSD